MRYQQGQPVRVDWRVYDIDGTTPVNPTTQTLTVLRPDATTQAYTSPSTSGTGVFYQVLPATDLTQVGEYQWKVVTVGDGAGVVTDSFSVIDPFETELLSLDDARQHLNLTGTTNDAELEVYLAAVTDAIEAYIGPVGRRTVTETVYPTSGVLLLSTSPVLSITSITPYAGVALGAGTYSLRPGGFVYPATYAAGFYAPEYAVVYVAGRAAVPAAVNMAARLVLQRLWETQRGGSVSPQIIGAASADFGVEQTAFSYVKSYGVRELLDPYRLAPAVA